MGTNIGDYMGTTIGIHSPIPYEAPGSKGPGVGGRVQRIRGNGGT